MSKLKRKMYLVASLPPAGRGLELLCEYKLFRLPQTLEEESPWLCMVMGLPRCVESLEFDKQYQSDSGDSLFPCLHGFHSNRLQSAPEQAWGLFCTLNLQSLAQCLGGTKRSIDVS